MDKNETEIRTVLAIRSGKRAVSVMTSSAAAKCRTPILVARVAAIFLVVAYLTTALWPFRINRLRNGAVVQNGVIRFPFAGLTLAEQSGGWLDTAIRENRFHIRLRVRSLNRHQIGPAQICTVSVSPWNHNLTIAQERANLVVRLRTTATDQNGTPPYVVRDVFADGQSHDIIVDAAEEKFSIEVDGEQVVHEQLPAHPLSNWRRECDVALGNEPTGDHPWLGDIFRAEVSVGGDTIDYLQPHQLRVPPVYWKGIDFRRFWLFMTATWDRRMVADAFLNFLCFVPVGFVLNFVRRPHGSITLVVAVCALMCGGVEVAQLCFDTRCPSLLDWLLNTLGGMAGAIAAYFFMARIEVAGKWQSKHRNKILPR